MWTDSGAGTTSAAMNESIFGFGASVRLLFWMQLAKVGYFTPCKAANRGPLRPLA